VYEIDEIFNLAFLVGDEHVTVEPDDPVPVGQVFSDEGNFGPLKLAFHVIEGQLFRDSHVVVGLGVTGLAKATRNDRPFVFLPSGQGAYCEFHMKI
jgi:hypothetical protein